MMPRVDPQLLLAWTLVIGSAHVVWKGVEMTLCLNGFLNM